MKIMNKLLVHSGTTKPRQGGQLKGLLDIPENFDESLPDDVLKQFDLDNPPNHTTDSIDNESNR